MKKAITLSLLLLTALFLTACTSIPKETEAAAANPATPAVTGVPAATVSAAPSGLLPSETPDTSKQAAVYRKITAAEAKTRMDSGDPVIILDVRTQEEYDAGHIAGAILIPNETIANDRPELLPDLNAEILIYCRSGNRSRQATEKLLAIGYTNLYDFGGINSWTYGTVTK